MSSAVGAVVTALVAAFGAQPALYGVEVIDGPPVESPGAVDLVMVGHDYGPDSDAEITVEQEWADLACTRRTERGAVPCSVLSQTGDVDVPGRRARVLQLLAACEAALRADLSLGGVVRVAQLESAGAHQFTNDKGTAVVVPFTVTYVASV
jgi:hypothetical protein